MKVPDLVFILLLLSVDAGASLSSANSEERKSNVDTGSEKNQFSELNERLTNSSVFELTKTLKQISESSNCFYLLAENLFLKQLYNPSMPRHNWQDHPP